MNTRTCPFLKQRDFFTQQPLKWTVLSVSLTTLYFYFSQARSLTSSTQSHFPISQRETFLKVAGQSLKCLIYTVCLKPFCFRCLFYANCSLLFIDGLFITLMHVLCDSTQLDICSRTSQMVYVAYRWYTVVMDRQQVEMFKAMI